MNNKNVADAIRQAVKERGITLNELAKRVGWSSQNLSNKLARANFSETEIQTLAHALDAEAEIVFRFDTQKTEPFGGVNTVVPDTVKKVYVASPLRAPTRAEVRRNMEYARRAVETLLAKRPGLRAYAPHAYLPDMLDDELPDERDTALAIGRMILDSCDAIYVCGDKITNGVKSEINVAIAEGKTIIASEWLQHAVQQHVAGFVSVFGE